MELLSVIIPSRNEEAYLANTVRNVLLNAEEDIEILVILDGWLPEKEIRVECRDGQSVVWIHNEEAIGQRHGINQAARQAKGKYMMKLDAHCAVSPGFDKELKKYCEPKDTVIPRMYNLNVETWQPKKHKRTDYMYIGWKDGWIRAQYYQGDNKAGNYKRDPEYDETMCCMGPGYFMHMDRFWELGGEDEQHGGWGQQGIEKACKAWFSGGRLMVLKSCWFAHFFRGGGVPEKVFNSPHKPKKGFPYSISQNHVDKARQWSHYLWIDGNWRNESWAKDAPPERGMDWLVKKFNPPTWEIEDSDIQKQYHSHIKGNYPKWLGYPVIKYPTDLLTYQQEIYSRKPDVIVEIGTFKGGSALFFASILELIGNGEVLSIDRHHKYDLPEHDRITYHVGRSTAKDTLDYVRSFTKGKKTMVVLDGDHSRRQVKRELSKYSDIVSQGQLLVAEDTICPQIGVKNGPDEAVEWYLKRSNKLKRTFAEKQFLYTTSPGGWLERV